MSNQLTDQEIEQVSDYVMNLLSRKERLELEQKIAQNPSLQAEVALQRQLLFVVEEIEDTRLKKMLQDEQIQIEEGQANGFSHQSAPSFSANRRWWIVLAAVLVLLLVYLFWQAQQSPNSEQIYASYFQPYDNVIVSTVRASQPSATVPLEVINTFRNYETGDYKAALTAFNQLTPEQQIVDYQFYKAMILLELDEASVAIPILQNLMQDTTSQFQEHAHWYLALAYLKEKNRPQSIATLNDLLDWEAIIFKDKALKLRQDLGVEKEKK